MLEHRKIKEQKPEILSIATLALIDKAQKCFKTGEGITIKEARELNRKRYQAWLKIPHEEIRVWEEQGNQI